eukprot:5006573-Pyramimonas_sp.AAC.1
MLCGTRDCSHCRYADARRQGSQGRRPPSPRELPRGAPREVAPSQRNAVSYTAWAPLARA